MFHVRWLAFLLAMVLAGCSQSKPTPTPTPPPPTPVVVPPVVVSPAPVVIPPVVVPPAPITPPVSQQAWQMQFPNATSPLPLTFYQIPEGNLSLPAWYSAPPGSGPFPLIIMIAGSDGLWGATGPTGTTPDGWQQYQFWSQWFVANGYATLIVDSFTPRGIQQAANKASSTPISGTVIAPDYTAAANYMASVPSVNAKEIAIMGDSLSGGAVSRAATSPGPFAAAIALYPGCSGGANSIFQVPLIIFQGLRDNNVSNPLNCETLGQVSRASGAPVTVIMYPAATHVYDVDKPTRSPAPGITLAYDGPATADTQANILSYLQRYLVPVLPFTGERTTLIISQVQ